MMSFEDAVAAIERAGTFPDLLKGELAVGDAGHAYRMLVKIVHPDVVPAARRATATRAAAKLSRLWAERRSLTTRRATYRLGERVADGDIADLLELDDDKLLKLPRQPGDNESPR
jgi:hypothetical protein